MKHCSNLYFLSTVACQLSECLTQDEIELLAANLKALGEMLEVISVQQTICKENMEQ